MEAQKWMDGSIMTLLTTPQSNLSSIGSSHYDEVEPERQDQSSKRSMIDRLRDVGSLQHAFFDSVIAFNTPERIFDMMENFMEICAGCSETPFKRSSQDRSWLDSEKNTWKLIHALYKNRLQYSSVTSVLHTENDLDIVKKFYDRDNSIRECQVVVDWLEACEASRADECVLPKVAHFTDKTVAWENTLHQIQVRNVSYGSSRDLVKEMDPDAPHREKRQLHDLDVEDETRLLGQMWTEIRCGRLDKALEICNISGHKWRAAILQGWMLFNDPNYKHPNDDCVISAFGNPHRDIWKLCAWQMTEKSICSTLWKAIIGAFCGNFSALLPFCKKWEDLLWAYMKVYVDVQVEQEIRSVSSRPLVCLPEQYWDFKFTVDEIFEEIAGCADSDVRLEASKPTRLIQRLIIMDRIPELICMLADWCSSDDINVNLVRLSAHIVIFLRTIRLEQHKQKAEGILKAYVKLLMNTSDAELIAYYTSMLSKADQIDYYSQFLESVGHEEDRIRCLEIAEACRLPVDEITKHVVRVIRDKAWESNDSISLSSGISREDEQKISSLNLIMHYAHQRDEALWETNALIRYFLAQRNLQAANYAFCKVPENSIEIILMNIGVDESTLQTNPDMIPHKVFAIIREYFCYKAYLSAEMRFADWFHCFHKEKPKRPVAPSHDSQYSEKVTYEHCMAAYNTEYAKWKSTIEEQTEIVKSHLYNVLLFPDGGWLTERRFIEDQERICQMNNLRKSCIPKITILLHSVLSSMDMLDECLKLAEIITSETYRIYEAYSVQDLSEILKKICDTSVEFLKQEKDPFGLQISS